MNNSMEGVVILLASHTRIPAWLSNSGTKVVRIRIRRKKFIRGLKIEGGEAKFVPKDGVYEAGVYAKTSRMRSFRKAFPAVKVLEIRNFEGQLLERNYCFCRNCLMNAGQIMFSEERADKMINVIVRCSRCKHEWKLFGIEPSVRQLADVK